MQLLISGSNGLVGQALIGPLGGQGHRIVRLVRARPSPSGDEVLWDPEAGTIDAEGLEGVEAVVHLAGEPIASGRWTERRKAAIRDSRIDGSRLLARALMRLRRPPRVVLSASAVGYYGDAADAVLTESSPSGTGFLADVCRAWEAAWLPATEKGIPVAHLRFGVILSPAGGMLKRLLPIFRLGLGGRLGSGDQYMSWIALPDVVGVIQYLLADVRLSGAFNMVSPEPVTNRAFTQALARTLHRPAIFPVPAGAVRFAFGEMADALLLSSSRVVPQRLLESSYAFRYPHLDDALRDLLSGVSPKQMEKTHAPVA